MFEAAAIGVMLVLKLFPDTPAARFLHRDLVERPAAWLSSRTRRHLLFVLMVVAIGFAGTEFVLLAGSADVAMLLAWDISLYVDTIIAVALASSVTRLGALRHHVASAWRAARPRRKRRAIRSGKASRKGANDDDPDLGLRAA
jgi:hypothetical protein